MLKVLEVALWVIAMGSSVWSVLRYGDWLPEVFVGLAFAGLSVVMFADEGESFFAYFAAFTAVFSFAGAWVNFRNGGDDLDLPEDDPDLGRI